MKVICNNENIIIININVCNNNINDVILNINV